MTKWLLGLCLVIGVPLAIVIFDRTKEFSPVYARTYFRVVALAPSMTETMIALNQTHRLVGVTVQCQDPAVKHIGRIGTFAEPSFEAIIAAQPDLVLGVPHVMAKPVLDRLTKAGIEVFAHQPDSISDIKFIVSRLAAKFAVNAEGRRVNEHIDRSILLAKSALYQMVMSHHRRTALIVVASSPFVVAGQSTFASQIIEAVGLNNIASSKTAWPVWPLEKLISEPPAFLIIAGGKAALPSFQTIFSSLGVDTVRRHIALMVPEQPIFYSPSPTIIKDIESLTDLFLADI